MSSNTFIGTYSDMLHSTCAAVACIQVSWRPRLPAGTPQEGGFLFFPVPLLLSYVHARTHRRGLSTMARLAPLPVYSPGLPRQNRAQSDPHHPVPRQAARLEPGQVRLDPLTLVPPRCVRMG